MTWHLDINTLASWATVAVAAVAGAGFLRKGSRWFEKTDERLAELERGREATDERLDRIDAELRPNGGGSHHDVLRRELREAVEEAARGRRRGWW